MWGTDGKLSVKRTNGTTLWTSGWSNGAYLCNQEDGNLVIYDNTYMKLWSSGTGGGTLSYNFDGWGGDLVLAGPQVQVLAASGEPTWINGVCAETPAWACSYPAQTAQTTVTTQPCWYPGSTVLSNEYADLLFDSSGALLLSDKSSGTATTIWKQSPSYSASMTSKKVCATSNGLFIFGGTTSSYTSVWLSGYTNPLPGSILALSGCNLAILDPNGAAGYSTKTACSYGAYNSVNWLAN